MIEFQMAKKNKKLAAIYIPGLGDTRPRGQNLAIKLLRVFGIRAEYFPFVWSESSGFEVKLEKLERRIDQLSTDGFKVNLIAASAGASGALNAFASRQEEVSSVTLICGKVNNVDKVGEVYFKNNPHFKPSLEMLPTSMSKLSKESRAKIMSIRPRGDSVVPPKDTIIEGAKNLQSFTFGHTPTIIHYLTVGSPRVAWWIKKNSKFQIYDRFRL